MNLAKDRWRTRRRRVNEVSVEPDVSLPEDEAALERDDVLAAVRTLPAGQRSVLVLRFFDDLTVAETASALGCSEGTVKSQTARALDRLRGLLNNERNIIDADR